MRHRNVAECNLCILGSIILRIIPWTGIDGYDRRRIYHYRSRRRACYDESAGSVPEESERIDRYRSGELKKSLQRNNM